eukprot:9503166-Pyramimonas_sp.AAC.3
MGIGFIAAIVNRILGSQAMLTHELIKQMCLPSEMIFSKTFARGAGVGADEGGRRVGVRDRAEMSAGINSNEGRCVIRDLAEETPDLVQAAQEERPIL